jgi:hypothetical protein
VPRAKRIESVFLNIPYDRAFEALYLAYLVGLTQLGLRLRAALAVPKQDRLATIIELIEQSNFSIHDLSRVQVSRGVPRSNMPVELDLAFYRSHATKGKHRVLIFESRATVPSAPPATGTESIRRSINEGTPNGVMSALRNIFRQPGDVRPYRRCSPVIAP